jgi:undecaprenyl-diphosphatase
VLLLRGGTHKYAALGCSAAAVLSGILLFWALKKVCHRKRPCQIAAHCWASVRPPDPFSFPSGHTITAFATAFSTGFFYPALFAPLLVAAIAIGISRVVLGMHFVSDVLIGAALGTGLACASYHLIR